MSLNNESRRKSDGNRKVGKSIMHFSAYPGAQSVVFVKEASGHVRIFATETSSRGDGKNKRRCLYESYVPADTAEGDKLTVEGETIDGLTNVTIEWSCHPPVTVPVCQNTEEAKESSFLAVPEVKCCAEEADLPLEEECKNLLNILPDYNCYNVDEWFD
jgi:hypothetical protein